MAFWNRKRLEEKAAPPIGAMLVSMMGPANWMKPDAYALEGYSQNPVAYACVAKIARSAASVCIKVMRYQGDKKQEVESSPLIDLLDRPNPEQGWEEFLEAVISHRLISGNAFILRLPHGAKAPQELYTLRPDLVKIEANNKGQATAYVYGSGANGVRFPIDPITRACDVVQLKGFNPLDNLHGLSSMAPAAKSIDIVNDALAWNKSLLENSGAPSGAYVVQTGADGRAGTLTDEQYTRLREQLKRENMGAANAGRPLLLEGGLDWKQIAMSPKDMDFRENLWAAARMIATAYGVPPQLINIPGEATYNNLSEAKLAFWQDTVLPMLKSVLGTLNKWLVPGYGEDLWLEYDEDSVPALEERRLAKYERLEKVSFLTIDEKRRAAGYDDYTEGKTPGSILLVPAGNVPIDLAGEMGGLSEPGSTNSESSI